MGIISGLLSKIFWLIVLIIGAGVAFAIAEPENVLATPFRGMAATTLETSVSMMGMFRDARTVAASHEFSVMQSVIQTMQIRESVRELPVVTTPTKDMTIFPSTEHPLYPDYFESKQTQFSYAINSKGELITNKDEASIDPVITDVLEKLNRLGKGEKPETVFGAK